MTGVSELDFHVPDYAFYEHQSAKKCEICNAREQGAQHAKQERAAERVTSPSGAVPFRPATDFRAAFFIIYACLCICACFPVPD